MRILLTALALGVALAANADEDNDVLYQVSTIDALLSSVYSSVATVGSVTKHGDFGLGTFAALDGELILLDGVVYQAAFDGVVNIMPSVVCNNISARTSKIHPPRHQQSIPQWYRTASDVAGRSVIDPQRPSVLRTTTAAMQPTADIARVTFCITEVPDRACPRPSRLGRCYGTGAGRGHQPSAV